MLPKMESLETLMWVQRKGQDRKFDTGTTEAGTVTLPGSNF